MISNTLRIQHLYRAHTYQGKPHFHNLNEVLFTMDDESLLYLNQDVFTLRAGTLTMIASGCMHAKVNKRLDQINSYVIHYPPALLGELSTLSTDLHALFASANYCMHLEPEDQQKVFAMMNQLDMEPDSFGADLHNLLAFGEILLTASKSMRRQGVAKPSFNMREDQWLRPILAFIDSHLKEELTLERLSNQFFISRGNLCRTFHKKTNSTVVSYINMQRINLACILLRQGLSVQETAKETGFHTVEHFIRTFTSFVKSTPGQYAKAIRSGTNVDIPLTILSAKEKE